jgi:hypothetical protein
MDRHTKVDRNTIKCNSRILSEDIKGKLSPFEKGSGEELPLSLKLFFHIAHSY